MSLRKIEFWLATLALLLWSVVLIIQYNEGAFAAERAAYIDANPLNVLAGTVGSRILLVIYGYGAFLLLNNYVFAGLYQRKKWDLVILYSLLTAVGLATAFYLNGLQRNRLLLSDGPFLPADELLPISVLTISLILGYIVLKKVVLYVLGRIKESDGQLKGLANEVLYGLLTWLFILVLIGNLSDSWLILHFWAFMVPCSYLVFRLNTHWLLPRYEKEGKDLLAHSLRSLLFTFLLSCCFGIFYGRGNPDAFIIFWGVQLVIVSPFAFFFYHRNQKRQQQLYSLESALGQTSADLQLLRSQINPHFLFNALNTLYGTALQENSDRTAHGIQMLGDMMRFMLHENLQDSISLQKEIEYLRNYIELQALRIQGSENISIETRIEEHSCFYRLAPMLLIPFVENAFKHGISLKRSSWIRINLSCDAQHLYFDVYNSLHAKTENDTETDKGGIGLENVRQRLQLFYPGEHELIIRKTAQEYVVHLTLKLMPVLKPEAGKAVPATEVQVAVPAEVRV